MADIEARLERLRRQSAAHHAAGEQWAAAVLRDNRLALEVSFHEKDRAKALGDLRWADNKWWVTAAHAPALIDYWHNSDRLYFGYLKDALHAREPGYVRTAMVPVVGPMDKFMRKK